MDKLLYLMRYFRDVRSSVMFGLDGPAARALAVLVVAAPMLNACGSFAENPDASIPVRYGSASERQIDVVPQRKPPVPAQQLRIASLVGSTMAEIESALGRPSAVRDQKPAVIYEYRTEGCEMQVMFFMDVERHEFRVLSYDVKAEQKQYGDVQRCVDGIASSKVPS